MTAHAACLRDANSRFIQTILDSIGKRETAYCCLHNGDAARLGGSVAQCEIQDQLMGSPRSAEMRFDMRNKKGVK